MEYVELVKEYISPELLVLVPVMYFIGLGIKKSKLKDNLIPLLLGVVSVLLTGLYLFATMDYNSVKEVMLVIFSTLTQGVIIAALSVYFNQLYKQLKK